MKNGQAESQIFIYITAAIIIGAIVLVGYSAIGTLLDKKCTVEKIDFKTRIETLLEKDSSYGTIDQKTISAPCDYEKICFVSTRYNHQGFECSENMIIEDIAKDNTDNNIEDNIFVVSNGRTIGIGKSPYVNTPNSNSCECIENDNGNFRIVFSGEGQSATVQSLKSFQNIQVNNPGDNRGREE